MKKLIFTICLFFVPFITYAYDCGNPDYTYQVLLGVLGTYRCGTATDPATIWYARAMGTGGFAAQGCQPGMGAPINGGLIFLSIAGIGMGVYLLYKNPKETTAL